ncbi:MAG TPA: HAMP domain-containing histidine kinase, partial [Helicobacteraceae bacterium]|nr:HAMP domain-containing histidine kinase [Helicobacteraceae bacterium]
IKEIQIDNFSMDTFSVDATGFHKYVPYQWHHGYYLLHKSRANFDAKLSDLRFFIISVQLALLLFFALLSFFLAGNALLPMRDALMKLDMFSKDLIHDLNTPLTAMKLNLKLLQKEPTLQKNRALERLNKSLSDVTELHQNLHVLLEEETFLLEYLKVETLIKEVAQTQQQLYPNITWEFHCHDCKVYSNYKALKQILYNLLSNACKYNEKEGIVRIICQEGHLIIEDSGIGIQNPEKIFSRAYKEQQQGFGIGLDIVQRLCDAMHITIAAQSLEKGSRFTLNFQKSNTSSS